MIFGLIQGLKNVIADIGGALMFLWQVFRATLQGGIRPSQVVEQMYVVGVRSFSTTVVTGLFVGGIMAIQINLQLRDFGAQSYLGGLATSVTIRNLGPVLIAFILSGKVGAYSSAELATMQVTDQINAIRCLGADPVRYLVVPRFVAVVLANFMLLIVGLMMTIGGGVAISSWKLGVNSINYIQNIPGLVSGWSVGLGVVKSFVFGVLIGVLACYKGYGAEGGAAGVGKAVRSAAVTTLVWIIVVDWLLTWVSGHLETFLGFGG